MRFQRPGFGDLDGISPEVGRVQFLAKQAAICMRAGPHAPFALRRERAQFGLQRTFFVKQVLRIIAFHPVFKNFAMRIIFPAIGDRNLMRSPVVLDDQPVDFLRAGPAFRASQNDHGPAGALR